MLSIKKYKFTAMLILIGLSQTSVYPTYSATSSDKEAHSAKVKASISNIDFQLKRMGEATHRLKKAANDLIVECVQPYEFAGEIEFIGSDVIPILPNTTEGYNVQYMPPRAKYVNLAMQSLDSLIPILQDDISTLNMPISANTDDRTLVGNMNNGLTNIQEHYSNLEKIVKEAPPYKQELMVKEAKAIIELDKEIDELRKKLYHQLKSHK